MIGSRLTALAAAVAALAGLAIDLSGTLDDSERSTIDQRFALRGAEEPRDDVVLVGIDDVTFGELQERWPFSRALHAQAIERIAAARPKAIVYDVQFSEPTRPDCGDEDVEDPGCREAIEADNALVLAARQAGNVVFATTEVDERGRPNVLGGAEALQYARATAGNARFDIDPGGVYRRGRRSVDGLLSLPLAAVERVRGRPLSADDVPEDPFWIDYAGPPGTIPLVSFSRVVRGRVPPARLAGKIVVVGPVAQVLQDVHPTSFKDEGEMSGAEIQANAIATALDGFPLRGIPRWLALVITVALALVPHGAAAALRRSRRLPGAVGRAVGLLGITLLAGAAWFGIAWLAFSLGRIVPLAVPLAVLATSGVIALALGYVEEAFEREWTRRVFGRFVSDDVVALVMDRTDGNRAPRLGGERVDVTILLSDIRGFTSYSEQHRPEVVIEVLNRYLSRMTDAILDHGGTVTGYRGDGILAVFGAPIAYIDHADRALDAARTMLRACEELNRDLLAEGSAVGFKVGIGLNTGPVMAGNIGSERRLEYTVIGDVVNTASRIEAATKGTPFQLFLAETTFRALRRDHDGLGFHDTLPIRGRLAAVGVYALQEPFVSPAGTGVPGTDST